ncbi:von Hippel-Lindau disease tumor suppressor isoform X2 [Heptranchias perlo]|uniref:von Hippel-Lindau disease tumor suppressor isoform X2 n=1 Tax=Heptranchias perlo TaxID=212740 RepID=UPI0035596706
MPENVNPDAAVALGRLRSYHSLQRSFVTFCNCTGRSVRPVWINYRGEPEPYAKMAAQSGRRMNTFLGHPWMFRDAVSDDRLLVNGHEVFVPPPGQFNEIGQPRYIVVNITIPEARPTRMEESTCALPCAQHERGISNIHNWPWLGG